MVISFRRVRLHTYTTVLSIGQCLVRGQRLLFACHQKIIDYGLPSTSNIFGFRIFVNMFRLQSGNNNINLTVKQYIHLLHGNIIHKLKSVVLLRGFGGWAFQFSEWITMFVRSEYLIVQLDCVYCNQSNSSGK